MSISGFNTPTSLVEDVGSSLREGRGQGEVGRMIERGYGLDGSREGSEWSFAEEEEEGRPGEHVEQDRRRSEQGESFYDDDDDEGEGSEGVWSVLEGGDEREA